MKNTILGLLSRIYLNKFSFFFKEGEFIMRIGLTGKLFILYGPSGSGKSTLMAEIIKRFPAHLIAPVITYTSRLPRANEVSGKDYYFISEKDFLEKLNSGFFIHTTNYLSNYYGCSKELIEELQDGKNFIAIFDRVGAHEVKNTIPDSVLIWVTAPIQELEERLKTRYASNPAQFASRLELARQDIKTEEADKIYDYKIVNSDLEQAYETLETIIKNELLNS